MQDMQVIKDTLATAGFHAAHSVWVLSEAGRLSPSICNLNSDNTRALERMFHDEDDADAHWQQRIQRPGPGILGMSCATKGFLEVGLLRISVIKVEVCQSGRPDKRLVFMVPFRDCEEHSGFEVMMPLLFDSQDYTRDDKLWIMESFFVGVRSHQKGNDAWNAHYNKYLIEDLLAAG